MTNSISPLHPTHSITEIKPKASSPKKDNYTPPSIPSQPTHSNQNHFHFHYHFHHGEQEPIQQSKVCILFLLFLLQFGGGCKDIEFGSRFWRNSELSLWEWWKVKSDVERNQSIRMG